MSEDWNEYDKMTRQLTINLSQEDYDNLVRDAILWRKQQMTVGDGWISIKRIWYDTLLKQAQAMDPGEEYKPDGSPTHGPYPGDPLKRQGGNQ